MKVKRLMSLCKVFGAVYIAQASIAHSADLCTTEFLKQMRTEYSFVDKTELSEVVAQAACSKDERTTKAEYTGASFSKSDVQNACSKNDRSFFQKNNRALALSYLPVAAIEQIGRFCDSGANNLTLNVQGASGDQVVIEAKWSAPGTGVYSVRVASFTVQGPANCPSDGALKAGAAIGGGGTTMSCTRIGDGAVTSVLVAVNPKVKSEPISRFASATRISTPIFELALNGVDDVISCSVNDSVVAGLSYGDPPKRITLNSSLKAGLNTLVCTVSDLKPGSNFQPCWGYSFNVFKNGLAIAAPAFSCCDTSAKCSQRGEKVVVPIEYLQTN